VNLLTAQRELFSDEFFDLQLRFAAKVAELSGLPLTETVGSHTNIYVRLGMGPQLDTENPEWLEYLSALHTAHDPAAWTHELHRVALAAEVSALGDLVSAAAGAARADAPGIYKPEISEPFSNVVGGIAAGALAAPAPIIDRVFKHD